MLSELPGSNSISTHLLSTAHMSALEEIKGFFARAHLYLQTKSKQCIISNFERCEEQVIVSQDKRACGQVPVALEIQKQNDEIQAQYFLW